MSSPPPIVGLSLPGANPKKRPSLPTTSSSGPTNSSTATAQQQQQQQPPTKRPRVQHPLAQTSFPSSAEADPRVYTRAGSFDKGVRSDAGGSGSMTGSFTGSFSGSFSGSFVGSASARSVDGRGGGGPRRKKGGRKEKEREKEREREGTGSVKNGGGVRTETGSVTGSMRAGEGGVDEEEDEEDEDLGDGGLLGGDDAAADAIAEKENLAVLIDAFTPEQSTRYDLFKRSKLNKPTLRKIVNQTLSQSVPPAVITTVSGFTKVFIGELIEKARTVQSEWAEAADSLAIEAAEKAEREEEERKAQKTREEAESAEEVARLAARESSATLLTGGANTPDTDGLAPPAQNGVKMSDADSDEVGDGDRVKPENKGRDTNAVKPESVSQENGIQAIPLHQSQQERPAVQAQQNIPLQQQSQQQHTIQSALGQYQPQQQRQHQSPYAPLQSTQQPPAQLQQPAQQSKYQVQTQLSSQQQQPPSTQSTVRDTPPPPPNPQKRTRRLPPNPHRGPLMPSHLREALRRHKRSAEGGNVGFSGLSLNGYGVKGSLSWAVRGGGGRRLFR